MVEVQHCTPYGTLADDGEDVCQDRWQKHWSNDPRPREKPEEESRQPREDSAGEATIARRVPGGIVAVDALQTERTAGDADTQTIGESAVPLRERPICVRKGQRDAETSAARLRPLFQIGLFKT